MFELRRAGLIGGMMLTFALILAACGGATATSAPAGEATPTPAGEATPTPAGEATPTPAGEATPTPTIDALPSFDLEALSGGLPGVDSYRTETSLNGVLQYASVVVKEPVLSKAITIYDGGDVTQRFIVIGQEAWTAEGADGTFEPMPAQLASTMLVAFDPALMLGAYASVDWAGAAANVGTEEKNGIQAHHVRIDSTTGVGAAAAMPAGSAIDIWVANEGYLVAWEMTGFPDDANFSIQVTGVNDPANQVERPD